MPSYRTIRRRILLSSGDSGFQFAATGCIISAKVKVFAPHRERLLSLESMDVIDGRRRCTEPCVFPRRIVERDFTVEFNTEVRGAATNCLQDINCSSGRSQDIHILGREDRRVRMLL